MQSDYLPELGEEFAAISSGVCGLSPLMAKLILYTELDDGMGGTSGASSARRTESPPTSFRTLALLCHGGLTVSHRSVSRWQGSASRRVIWQ